VEELRAEAQQSRETAMLVLELKGTLALVWLVASHREGGRST